MLSTGGKISDYAKKMNYDLIQFPVGYQPRAAIGYSFTIILLLLNSLGLISHSIINCVKKLP